MANDVQAMVRTNRWRLFGWAAAVALILAPLVAMQLDAPGVNWTAGDFLFAIVLIGGTGLLFELAARASRSWAYRGGVALALIASFLIIWINGAVGIIGDEDNPANLVFGVVLAIEIAGVIVARAKAEGMVRAMAVTAGAQALIGLIVFARGIATNEPPGALGLLILIEGFAVLWLGSALLFARAVREA
ncbi:MAG TPA: hypothetical protein VNS53_06080 [Sphingomicrobium sp.]|nr:hypothetical protein [Sphingomicrobium sp.]